MRGLRTAAFLAVAAATFAAVPAKAQHLAILEPVRMGDQEAAKARPGDGTPAPVLTRVTGGPLFAAIQREAKGGTIPVILQLGEMARRIAGLPANGASWLMLSEEEGGFAKRGFWLRTPRGDRWIADPYVNMGKRNN